MSGTVFTVAILGQSNARGLRMEYGDKESGVTVLQKSLSDYLHLPVIAKFKNDDGSDCDLAVGGSRVNGRSYNTEAQHQKNWWLTDTDQPGQALLNAVDNLHRQLDNLVAQGLEPQLSMVWGQGENDATLIGATSRPLQAIEDYRENTLKVFDYLKAEFGDQITIYMMQTGRYLADAAAARGYDQAKIDGIMYGVEQVRQVQEEIATMRDDVKIALNYDDLPMNYEVNPEHYPDDPWHIDPEARETMGQRLAEYIALDQGLTHILVSPGKLPISALADIDIKDGPGVSVVSGASADLLVGTNSADTLFGGSQNDTFLGGDGNDDISGGSGQDLIFGGLGADKLNGNSGSDQYRYFSREESTYDAPDILQFVQGEDKINLTGLGFTGIQSGDASGSLLGFTVEGGMTVISDEAHDFKILLNGNQQLQASDFIGFNAFQAMALGQSFNDSGAADTFHGTDGNDTMHGGVGQDIYLGCGGSDIFVFSAMSDSTETARDAILDFEVGVDKIDLSALAFHGITQGRAAEGELRYFYSDVSDRTYIKDYHSDFQFYLKGDYTHTLQESDFIFSSEAEAI